MGGARIRRAGAGSVQGSSRSSRPLALGSLPLLRSAPLPESVPALKSLSALAPLPGLGSLAALAPLPVQGSLPAVYSDILSLYSDTLPVSRALICGGLGSL